MKNQIIISSRITLTIGQDCEIISYDTIQRGYGRQSLYVDLNTNEHGYFYKVYVKDVFPNIEEHFNSYILEQYASENEQGVIHDDNGREYELEDVCRTIEEMLNKALDGREINIEPKEED